MFAVTAFLAPPLMASDTQSAYGDLDWNPKTITVDVASHISMDPDPNRDGMSNGADLAFAATRWLGLDDDLGFVNGQTIAAIASHWLSSSSAGARQEQARARAIDATFGNELHLAPIYPPR